MPPNPMNFGAAPGSQEEKDMLGLILAVMGQQGAFDFYNSKRNKSGSSKVAADSSADAIIGRDLK